MSGLYIRHFMLDNSKYVHTCIKMLVQYKKIKNKIKMASSVREPRATTAPLDKVLSRLFGSRENPPPDKFYITIQNKLIDFATFSEKVLKKSLNHLNAKGEYDVMSGGEGFKTFARGSVPVHIESYTLYPTIDLGL